MQRKFGSRLAKPEYYTEALKLSQYDDLFQFGVASLVDDNHLSKDEGTAFFNSISKGDAAPMQEYITNQTNHKVSMANVNKTHGT